MHPDRGPEYDLGEVGACLASRRVSIARRSALDMIQAHLRLDHWRVRRFAEELVASLRPGNFSRTVRLADGTWADEYGIVADGISWYVKLQVDPAGLHVVSCHLPDRDIHTVDGIVTCTHHGTRDHA
jgi:hypothetical protein